tara:strand:- start:3409 stop:4104 length:696 start_codon:yes stop_codon:yes gene_type:complete
MKFLTIKLVKNNKALSLFSIFFTLLFISLGFWQIERAESKALKMKAFNEMQKSPPIILKDLSAAWSRVFVEGFYDSSRQVLIDNQINDGQVGYKIYTPFYFDDKAIFVDRGWIPRGKTRSELPDIVFQSDRLRIVGSLLKPEKEVLAGDDIFTKNWPIVSQTKLPSIIETKFNKDFYDSVIVLEPGSNFLKEYIPIQPFVISPTKHYGYALQWFTMSIVLFSMFIYAINKE